MRCDARWENKADSPHPALGQIPYISSLLLSQGSKIHFCLCELNSARAEKDTPRVSLLEPVPERHVRMAEFMDEVTVSCT